MASLIAAFTYKKKLKFDTDTIGVDTNQTNFPVCVHINTSSWATQAERDAFFAAWNVGGKRCQFFDADGTTNLDYEVELYASGTPEAIYWARTPQVDGNSTADYIWVAFGNDPNGTDQDNHEGVWNTNFKFVNHLADYNLEAYKSQVYQAGATEAYYLYEPMVIYRAGETHPFKMWAHVTDATPRIFYYYSDDGISWTRVGLASPASTYLESHVLWNPEGDNKYWMYAADTFGDHFDLLTSSSETGFTVDTADVLLKSGDNTKFDETAVYNPYIWYEEPDSTANLSTSMDDSTTECDVTDTSKFAATQYIKIESEWMLVTSVVNATHCHVTRAKLGTSAAAHTQPQDVYKRQWYMAYDGAGAPNGGLILIGLATSYDGRIWTKQYNGSGAGGSWNFVGQLGSDAGTIYKVDGVYYHCGHGGLTGQTNTGTDIQGWSYSTDLASWSPLGGTGFQLFIPRTQTWEGTGHTDGQTSDLCGLADNNANPVTVGGYSYFYYCALMQQAIDSSHPMSMGLVKLLGTFSDWVINYPVSLCDSTSNNNDPDQMSWTMPATGVVGNGKSWRNDATGKTWIRFPDSASHDLGSSFTFEANIKLDAYLTGPDLVFVKDIVGAAGTRQFDVYLDAYEDNTKRPGFYYWDTDNHAVQGYVPSPLTYDVSGGWHTVAWVRNANTSLQIYVDGAAVTTSLSGTLDAAMQSTTQSLYIGYRSNDAAGMDGNLDELRMSNATRSADWLKLTYYSMKKTNFNGDSWLSWDAAIHFVTGSASLSGVGSLTSAGKRILKGTASASGIGALTVAGGTYTAGAASLSGVGALTATGEVIAGGEIIEGAASLAGTGLLSVSAVTYTLAASTLSGVGTLTSIGKRIFSGLASLEGAGTLTVSVGTSTFAACSLSGIGTLTSSALLFRPGAASLQGVGTLVMTGKLIRAGGSALSGAGTLSVTATTSTYASVSLQGVGTLTASGIAGAEVLGASILQGVGVLSSLSKILFAGVSSLSGVGILSIAGHLVKTASSGLLGIGSLTVSAEISAGIYGASVIQGVGTLTTSGKRIFTGSSSLSGAGTLSVSASIYTLGAASLSGIGTLTSVGGTYTLGSVSLSGTGTLTTSASIYTLAVCSLSGIGTLTASGLSLTLPVGITQTESNVEQTTARINGKISDDGGASCEARFRWRSTVGLTEEQTQVGYQDNMWSDYYTRLGQKLTISNRTITKLTFKLVKTGSPTGDVTFTIRKLNDDIIASKVWGDASALSGFLPTWYEKELDTPVLVNEEVRISAEFSGGNSTNFVSVTATSDCKANEVSQHYAVGLGWGDFDGEDRAYKYTYGDAWTTTDWQNTLVTDSLYHEDLTGLELGTEYEYQTQAKNSLGEGEWSSSETFTTQTIAYGATSLSGAGTLSTSGKLIRSGKGTLAGVGSLSITGKLILSGTSSITGVGSLTIMGATSTYASASLQGVGTLTAIGKAGTQVQGASVLEGVGTLSSLGRILFAGASSLSGVGTLTIISEVTRSATANLQGIGSLTISASLIKTSGSVLEGVGILVTEASVSTGLSGEASLQGVGTLSIMAKCIFAGASSLIGEGTLTIGGKLIKTASSSLEGVGSLSISSIVYKNAATVLTGVGTLETASRLILGGVSALQGIGTFTAEGQIIGWIEARASLEGVGTLSASAILSLVGASSLEGVGLVTADGTLLRASSQAQLSGAGSLSVIGSRVLSGASALTGIGEVTVSAGVIHYGASSLQGIGLLTAEIKEINFGSASLSGIGALLIVASLFKRGASDLNGVGLLVGQAIVLKSGRVILVGTGTLAIAATLLLTGQATMLGVGTLTAAWTEVITRHQDWIWKMPDRDLTMAMPVRNRTFKVRQHG